MWEYKCIDSSPSSADYLAHYGILGMRWGVRRSKTQLFRARKNRYETPEEEHEDYKKAHSNKSVKSMSDQELRARNNRLNMEKQYADLTRIKSKGESIVKSYVTTAATIAAVAKATAIYKEHCGKALDKVGDKIVSNIDWSKPLTS